MKNVKSLFLILLIAVSLASCSRVQPNYEGVLMTNYGRSGLESFTAVTGNQGFLGPGTELYQVSMFEQPADPKRIEISTKNAGVFTVDPIYSFRAIRGKGRDIIFNYKNYGPGTEQDFLPNIAVNILNKTVTNAYTEEAGNYSTDSLMNNRVQFERQIEKRLGKEFEARYFELVQLTSGLKPPLSMATAIEAANNSIQKANQVKNEIETSKLYQQKANIDAETNRIKAAGLDNKILMQQYIEMLKTTKNKVIFTDGKMPVIFNNN